jgi:hypothetical protein
MAGRIEGTIPASTDTRIQKSPREVLKEQWPQRAVAPPLEEQIKEIVECCDSLISIEIGYHLPRAPRALPYIGRAAGKAKEDTEATAIQ